MKLNEFDLTKREKDFLQSVVDWDGGYCAREEGSLGWATYLNQKSLNEEELEQNEYPYDFADRKEYILFLNGLKKKGVIEYYSEQADNYRHAQKQEWLYFGKNLTEYVEFEEDGYTILFTKPDVEETERENYYYDVINTITNHYLFSVKDNAYNETIEQRIKELENEK
jgi:hypothetical protein